LPSRSLTSKCHQALPFAEFRLLLREYLVIPVLIGFVGVELRLRCRWRHSEGGRLIATGETRLSDFLADAREQLEKVRGADCIFNIAKHLARFRLIASNKWQ